MSNAFIIMNIGQPDLDHMCSTSIVPALQSCGLEPKRVDKHNQGGLLKSEIIKFIQESDIIIADLTNERPNCYLEVGYTMGINKFKNLILTVREDHNQDSSDHIKGGPKVHFDLGGYDILFWRPDALDKFRDELTKRIRRRLSIIANSNPQIKAVWDDKWFEEQRNEAIDGFINLGFHTGMVIKHSLSDPKSQFTHQQLLNAAQHAQIHTFGWPIGIVPKNPEHGPRPRDNGIYAEIPIKLFDRVSYDYWAIRRNGDYYLLKSLLEDERFPSDSKFIYFNTRIERVTEAILHCARLYSSLGIDTMTTVHISIEYMGLKDRMLSTNSSRIVPPNLWCSEDHNETSITTQLYIIERDLVSIVKAFVQPLFVLFQFFELPDVVYEHIINDFVEGKVS